MPKYLIERDIPGAGQLSPDDLVGVAKKSNAVLGELGPEIQWVESYVSRDAITCLYVAPNERLLREHARLGGFPAERITEVLTVIDPTTAEGGARVGSA